MALRTVARGNEVLRTHLLVTPTAQRTMCGKPVTHAAFHRWLNEADNGDDVLFCTKCVKAAETRLT